MSCEQCFTGFSVNTVKQTADRQIICEGGKVWIQENKELLAGFTCAAFVVVAFFSLLFIAKEAHHDCTGEGCLVCACIHQAEQTLKQIGTGSAETTGAFVLSFR